MSHRAPQLYWVLPAAHILLWSDNIMRLLSYIYTYPYNIYYPYKSYKRIWSHQKGSSTTFNLPVDDGWPSGARFKFGTWATHCAERDFGQARSGGVVVLVEFWGDGPMKVCSLLCWKNSLLWMKLGDGNSNIFLFSPLFGEDFRFD